MATFRERFDTVLANKPYHWVHRFGDNRAQLHPGTLDACNDPACKEARS